MSKVDVITSILIHAPLDKVVQYASNPDNAPNWYINIHSVEWKTPKPLRIGSQIAFEAKFLRKKIIYTYEVVEYSDHKLVMRTAEGPFPMETTYLFEARGVNDTVMSLRNRGEPSGFSNLFAPLMSFMMRKANRKDLRKIKLILEKSIAGTDK